MKKVIKITLWALMGLALLPLAVVLCVANLLSPQMLTPVVEKTANDLLNAQVKIASVDINIRGHLPLLTLEIDTVEIISHSLAETPDSLKSQLPPWADTLLTVERFEGGLNLGALLTGKINLHDVKIIRPGINLLAVNDSIANYLIYTAEPDSSSSEITSLPDISLNSFSIISPKPIRFANLQTGEDFMARLSSLELDGSGRPVYALDLGGDIRSPQLSNLNLQDLRFGIDGGIGWSPKKPYFIELKDFLVQADFLKAVANAKIDLAHDILITDYNLTLGEMPLENLLAFIPDSLRREYMIEPDRISTDIALSFSAQSTAPFNLTTDSLPHAEFILDILPGKLTYDKAEFSDVHGRLSATMRGNDIALASAQVDDFHIQGKSTALTANIQMHDFSEDPLVTGAIEGSIDLGKLPARVYNDLNAFIDGKIMANVSFKGRPSMLDQANFHRLHADGEIKGQNLYFLTSDTANMVYARNALLTFGTNVKTATDSMLTAKIAIDSADILHTQYSMKVNDLSLGVGVSNRQPSADTTLVIPMGGDLSLGKFYMTVLGDSIAFNMRRAHGRVTMQRYKSHARLPLFGLDIEIGHISTGTPEMRFMLSNAQLHTKANKRPGKGRKPSKAVKAAVDSIKQVHPYMPIDSVYVHAIEVVRAKKHKGLPRIHPEITSEEAEIIYWGTSDFLRRLLTEWTLKGTLTAKRAGLFTPYFPLRNRVRNFNVAFDNDSIILENVKYKAGSSDFLISGTVANISRGLTSKGFRSAVKINFAVESDTIDINELASCTFRGSAYAEESEKKAKMKLSLQSLVDTEDASDADFEREMAKMVANAPDSMAPLLIPSNIEASVMMHSRNVLYSDLAFTDFGGEMLVSQGALSLHDLQARSDVGAIKLSALYSAPNIKDLRFGFGMQVKDFNIQRFTKLMPALDSIMPLLDDFRGIINASVAATCNLDRGMNIELPSLTAAIRLDGDSLVFIDPDTYRTIGKWLLFKDKTDNVIKHMNVEMTVKDNMMQLYPFIFDLDRYRLGVQGHNDLAMNFDYHIAVLKSPIPFKFGINIKGNPEKYKIRLGRARLNERTAAQSVAIVDTTRINLVAQLENVFKRGVANSRFARLNISSTPTAAAIDLNADTISHADSLLFIQEGLIPAPIAPQAPQQEKNKKSKKRSQRKNKPNSEAVKE